MMSFHPNDDERAELERIARQLELVRNHKGICQDLLGRVRQAMNGDLAPKVVLRPAKDFLASLND